MPRSSAAQCGHGRDAWNGRCSRLSVTSILNTMGGIMKPRSMLMTLVMVAAIFGMTPPTRWACAEMAGQSMSDLVKNAKSAADHEALAAMYDKEAAAAKEQAAAHQQMAQ